MQISNSTEQHETLVKENTRSNVLTFLWMLLIMSPLYVPIVKSESFSIVVIVGTLIMFTIVFLLFKHSLISISGINKRFLFMQILIGIAFLINGLFYRVLGYIAIGATFSIVVPVATIVFCSHKKEYICEFIAKGTIVAYIMYTVFCFIFGPKLGEQSYAGLLGNPNLLGNFICVVAPSVVFLWARIKEKSVKNNIIYSVLLSSLLALTYFSNSRTNMLALVVMLLYSLTMYILVYRKIATVKRIKYYAKNLTIIILCCCITFVGIFFMLTTVKDKIDVVVTNVLSELIGSPLTQDNNEGNGTLGESVEQDNNEGNVTLGESMDIAGDRFLKGLENNENDAFTSGRIGIWKAFISEIGFMGHAKESMDLDFGDRVYKDTNAHNYYIQIAFAAGIFTGIILLIYVFCTALEMIKRSFVLIRDCKMDDCIIFFGCIAIAFAVNSITSGGYMLYTYFIPTFFWLMSNNICLKE